MRVVALFRVSTQKQENEGASLDAQQRRYRELAAISGWTTVAEFRGQESATKVATERAVLQQVLACIREQAVDALWCFEQSRLTRGDELEAALLTRELRERGVRVLVGTTEHDLGEPSAAFLFGLQSQVDRYEVSRFKERTARGRREKALQGRWTCSKAPYGYRNPPPGDPRRGTLQPFPEEARIVRRMFEEAAGGRTMGRLAVLLTKEGIPTPRGGARWRKTTVTKILDNPAYLGRATLRDVAVEGAHEPLVSRELWDRAHAQRQGSSTGSPGLLTGLLYIEGERARIDRSRKASYYRAAERNGHAVPWLAVPTVNDLVWHGFTGILRRQEALGALLRRAGEQDAGEAIQARLQNLAQREARLVARAARLVDMRADGEISKEVFAEKSGEVTRQLREVRNATAEAKGRAESRSSGAVDRVVKALAAILGSRLTLEQQRRALRSLVARVDLALVPGAHQDRTEAGCFTSRSTPKWGIDQVYLHLHRAPAPSTTSWSSGQTWVTVKIVSAGQLLDPQEALRMAAVA